MDIASVLPVALGVGFVTGLRSMTGPAVVAWGARLGWMELGGTGFAFLNHPAAVVVFSLAALGEFVGDKLPQAPGRTAPGPFGVRVVFGALCGAALALGSGAAPIAPAIFGAIGAVLGTLGGYAYRTRFATRFKAPDFPFALAEDVLAVGLGLFLVSRLAS